MSQDKYSFCQKNGGFARKFDFVGFSRKQDKKLLRGKLKDELVGKVCGRKRWNGLLNSSFFVTFLLVRWKKTFLVLFTFFVTG
jgi:hypothetical protein